MASDTYMQLWDGESNLIGYTSFTGNHSALCPDLLSINDIGVADNFRGKVVRGFFRLISWWKP